MPETVLERLEIVRDQIARAAQSVGRNPEEISLMGVTKTLPASLVVEGVGAGLRMFGENRFQGTPEKIAEVVGAVGSLAEELEWHFIGQVQSNKVRKILETYDLIQGVDNVKLVDRIDRVASELGITARGLLQVNISGSESQGGVSIEELEALAEACINREHLRIEGLMAIGPITTNEVQLRNAFSSVREAAEMINTRQFPGVSMGTLSLGMSGDFEAAILEGSTLVRVGTAIFGPRTA